ncbi:MAG: peroxiredoxin [Actinomycetota bacterium]
MAKVDVGDRAPDFELPGTGGRTYRLSEFRGQEVVLAFYPGDFTPVCTKQFCAYRDDQDEIEALGVQMLGISPQPVESHERFADKYELTVRLLADEDRSVSRAYGVTVGRLLRRSIFLIDAEGIVRYRHVALIGASFQDVDDLQSAVAQLPSGRPAGSGATAEG